MPDSFVRAVLVSLAALAACSDLTGPGAELADARERWESRRMVQYEYRFQRSCFCIEEATRAAKVRVLTGVVTSAWYLSDGSPVPSENLRFYPTVDELFETIENAIERDADRLEVEYDRETGHPTRIDVDYLEQAADDELFIRAWELQQPHMPQGRTGLLRGDS